MKKKILGLALGIFIGLGILVYFNRTPSAWADIASLPQQLGMSVNWVDEIGLCSGNSGNTANNPSCNNLGTVNWSTMINWMESNVNWQDLPGVTGAPTSAATWIKANPA